MVSKYALMKMAVAVALATSASHNRNDEVIKQTKPILFHINIFCTLDIFTHLVFIYICRGSD